MSEGRPGPRPAEDRGSFPSRRAPNPFSPEPRRRFPGFASVILARAASRTLVVAVTASGAAWGHEEDYVNATGNFVLLCEVAGTGVNEGGACFEAGHLAPDANGRVTFAVRDGVVDPVVGYVCQDLDGDGASGPGDELGNRFCDGATLGPQVGWTPDAETLVFVDLFDNDPALSTCGFYEGSPRGGVGHT